MFRRTYSIQQNNGLAHFISKAIDFDTGVSLRGIGGGRDSQMLGLEYQGKIFPFEVRGVHVTDIEYKNVKACEIGLLTRPESWYSDEKAFFVDKERLVFDYETIEQYEEVCLQLRNALNVLSYCYAPSVGSGIHPAFFYSIKCDDTPHNMRIKSRPNQVISLKDEFLKAETPEELKLSELKLLTNPGVLAWAGKNKHVKEVDQYRQEIIQKFGGQERVSKIRKEKEEQVKGALITYVDANISPKSPKEIEAFFESVISDGRLITLEQAMAEVMELVALGAGKYHLGQSVNLSCIVSLTAPPILEVLKSCYDKE